VAFEDFRIIEASLEMPHDEPCGSVRLVVKQVDFSHSGLSRGGINRVETGERVVPDRAAPAGRRTVAGTLAGGRSRAANSGPA